MKKTRKAWIMLNSKGGIVDGHGIHVSLRDSDSIFKIFSGPSYEKQFGKKLEWKHVEATIIYDDAKTIDPKTVNHEELRKKDEALLAQLYLEKNIEPSIGSTDT